MSTHKFVYKAARLNLSLNNSYKKTKLSCTSNIPRDFPAVLVNRSLDAEILALKRLSQL